MILHLNINFILFSINYFFTYIQYNLYFLETDHNNYHSFLKNAINQKPKTREFEHSVLQVLIQMMIFTLNLIEIIVYNAEECNTNYTKYLFNNYTLIHI